MCCIANFIVKYILIIGNIVFCLAGITIIALGTVAHIQLDKLTEIIPVSLQPLSTSIIVLGVIIFFISYLACCGAIRESMCMLVTYSIFMAILAGIKIYITVVFFNFLNGAQNTVEGWIQTAFNNLNIRGAFHAMETLFRCCGTVGPSSYGNQIPPSCCANPIENLCPADQSYRGCNDIVARWFEVFGGAVAAVLLVIIIIELGCMILGLNMTNTIRNSRRRRIA